MSRAPSPQGRTPAASSRSQSPGASGAGTTISQPSSPVYPVRPIHKSTPLLVATAFVGQGLSTDKPPLAKGRAIVGLVGLCALTLAVGVPHLVDARYQLGDRSTDRLGGGDREDEKHKHLAGGIPKEMGKCNKIRI